jgi:NAD(P)H-hydrate epimerase
MHLSPMIIDADGLNIVARQLDVLDSCSGPRLLTPHPGEMARLDPGFSRRTRREAVEAFTSRYPFALLLKGARTIVGQRGEPLSYNTTGSPGLSTGGMGDVLTGVCAALAGRGSVSMMRRERGAGSADERQSSLSPTATPRSRSLHQC